MYNEEEEDEEEEDDEDEDFHPIVNESEEAIANLTLADLQAPAEGYSDAEDTGAASAAANIPASPATPVVDVDSDGGGGQLSAHSSTDGVQNIGLTLQERSDSVPALPGSSGNMPYISTPFTVRSCSVIIVCGNI